MSAAGEKLLRSVRSLRAAIEQGKELYMHEFEIVRIWAWQSDVYEQRGYTVQWDAGWRSMFGLRRRAVRRAEAGRST